MSNYSLYRILNILNSQNLEELGKRNVTHNLKSENRRFELLFKRFRLDNPTFGDQKQGLRDFIDLVQQDSQFFDIKKICWQQKLL